MNFKKCEFNGFDFSELASYFDVNLGEESSAKNLQNFLRLKLEQNKLNSDVVYPCRVFLRSLALQESKIGYNAPLWIGLSCIEDDFTFLSWFIDLLPGMWS